MVQHLLRQLPESHGAERLFTHLTENNNSLARLFQREPGLLSDVLSLAAWSPLLATTLEQNPDYVTWLQRERVNTRVRNHEELGESLGRFSLMNSTLDPHVMLARFRRRELLRTYLHDIRHSRTIVETTEELSNVADMVLEYALNRSRQELDNRYGAPQTADARGRILSAEFCVVALGKLGSRELNYASDIDLLFLFSDEGDTSGGSRGQITNREYFVKLGESLLRLVSEPIGEGAAYRIDVRLRPHGRDGALACGLDEAVRYYEHAAQDWELQALIRARSAAGSHPLYQRFAGRVIGRVFRSDISVPAALMNVRTAKENIDTQRQREEKGFNVKLGRGGIREIEFIAQALQVAFGGRDPWLRAAHTLISLGRLVDRGLITEREHSQLSRAYHFLRALEHRLQMEHGLQTHSLPSDPERRALVARRMDFSGDAGPADFEIALTQHATNVREAFDRLFGPADTALPDDRTASTAGNELADPDAASARLAASILLKHLASSGKAKPGLAALTTTLRTAADLSLNSHRALACLARVASSLDKESAPETITESELDSLVRLCGASEAFGEMIAGRTALIHALAKNRAMEQKRDKVFELRTGITDQQDFGSELDALRRIWSGLLIEIAAADAAGDLTLPDVNYLLTELAVAAIDGALGIARREFGRRFESLATEPRLAVLGLGRLGSGGMDYGSDLDVVIVYDSAGPAPVAGLTHEESYSRLAELMITALSSITREGHLYRVDLRLRPDGRKGPLVTGSEAFISYLQTRAGLWEWLAYVKLRAVAGELELGRSIEVAARKTIHEMAHQSNHNQLRAEAHRVRDRLEKEKTLRRIAGINIKHGAGGMLDVYFAARYLQLRDNVQDDDRDRTTAATLRRLRAAGSLNEADFIALNEGYALLRSVDHQLRLIAGRSARLPLPEHPAFRDIAKRLAYDSAQLTEAVTLRMSNIRIAYERIMTPEAIINGI